MLAIWPGVTLPRTAPRGRVLPPAGPLPSEGDLTGGRDMLAVYLFCLLAGGALVAASAIFGGKDADLGGHGADAGGDVDVDVDVDVSVDGHAGELGHGDAAHAGTWMPFLSMQFWTFALAFFGLTGTVLTLLALASTVPTLLAALALGLGSGTAVSTAIRRLRTETFSSALGGKDFVGRSGVVRVPLKAGSPGKVRVAAKGQLIDLIAVTDDEEEIASGEEVLVTEMQNGRAAVVRAVRVEQPRTHEPEAVAADGQGAELEKNK